MPDYRQWLTTIAIRAPGKRGDRTRETSSSGGIEMTAAGGCEHAECARVPLCELRTTCPPTLSKHWPSKEVFLKLASTVVLPGCTIYVSRRKRSEPFVAACVIIPLINKHSLAQRETVTPSRSHHTTPTTNPTQAPRASTSPSHPLLLLLAPAMYISSQLLSVIAAGAGSRTPPPQQQQRALGPRQSPGSVCRPPPRLPASPAPPRTRGPT